MAPTIPSLTWVAQTGAINKMKPSLSFLQNLLFSRHRTHRTEVIEVGYFTRSRRMAPMVRKGAAAIPIVGHSRNFAVVDAPNIRIKRAFSPEVQAFARQPGTGVFASEQEQSAAYEMGVAMDLQALRDDLGNRMEWMCAQALRGVISYSVADEEVVTITSPRAAGNSIVLSTFWDDGTPTNVRPEEDIETAQRVIHAAEGLNITHALCGASAATYLRRVAKANNWQLDVKGLFDAYQAINFGSPFNQDGARPIGRVNGVDFWEYATALPDEAGVSQVMIRDKYVEFVCATPAAENVMEFAGIPENVPGGVFKGEIFSKSFDEEDPPVRTAIVHTRPLPVLWRPDATVSMKVISG